jgi:undecaprenyl diphosphate synthase
LRILLIPDGNRRAARKLNLTYREVYRLAADRANMALKYLLGKEGIDTLAFFGTSFDNVAKRENEEMDPIYKAQEEQFIEWIDDPFFRKHQVRVKFVGESMRLRRSMIMTGGLSESYIKAMRQLEESTMSNTKKHFFILVGYSGKLELLEHLIRMHEPQSFETLSGLDGMNPPNILPFLSVPYNIDLVIRTGGEQRVSDCLLYQTAYSEFAFLEKYFPEIEEHDLEACIQEFIYRDRRFGK